MTPVRKSLACVILAAGAGTRMKSGLPKVLHEIYGTPMLKYVLDAAGGLSPEKIIIVVSDNVDLLRDAVGRVPGLSFALQTERKGTAHALISAMPLLKGFKGSVLVINGDTPLVTTATLRKFLRLHRKEGNALSAISFAAEDPGSYGRVVRSDDGRTLRVVEDRDATPAEKPIREVNSGIYAVEPEAVSLLPSIKLNKGKGEYYLTDLVGAAVSRGLNVGFYRLGDEAEFIGINTRRDLSRAHEALRKKTIGSLLDKGVSFIDTDTVFIDPRVRIGRDTVIYPNVFLHGDTSIGRNCTIYPNVRIIDSRIKDGTKIKDSTLIEGSSIGPNAEIGPFAHIRPESRIGSAKIGNFVEVKKSSISGGTKAMHLSYLGDAVIGKGVNIGAGTITCNYDGKKKHRTVIGDGVFIGSDSQLVAPVKLGKGSYVGAGSTITDDVPPDALALSRTKQKNIPGLGRRLRLGRRPESSRKRRLKE